MSRKTNKFKDNKQKRDGRQFITIPFVVLDRPSFYALSSSGNKLLLDIIRQYNGYNNGYLCCCFSIMQKCGWKSKETLQKAKTDLIKSGLIIETRKGGRPNRASYYAVTWLALDEQNGKTRLDIDSKIFPRGLYTHPHDYKDYLLSTNTVPVEDG